MKRRGFLGLIGGAAVAGPAAAKNIIAEALPISSGGNIMVGLAVDGGYGLVDEGPISSGGILGTIDRVSKLRRLISGEEPQEPEPYENEQRQRILAEHSISALQSVSVPAKLRMMARASDKRVAERKKQYWMIELKQILDRS